MRSSVRPQVHAAVMALLVLLAAAAAEAEVKIEYWGMWGGKTDIEGIIIDEFNKQNAGKSGQSCRLL